MKTVKPFARQGHYTAVDNAVLDEIMPMLSGNEWKVLSLIIRQTIGWQKDIDGIAYSQFRDGTGIKSNTTIQKSINELIKLGIVEVGKTSNINDPHFYRLNKEYQIGVTENVKCGVTFSVKPSVTENVNTKESKEIQKDIILR